MPLDLREEGSRSWCPRRRFKGRAARWSEFGGYEKRKGSLLYLVSQGLMVERRILQRDGVTLFVINWFVNISII